ncbi:MAG: hypothetical protein QM487_02425 [Candidatus Marithrix sp.]
MSLRNILSQKDGKIIKCNYSNEHYIEGYKPKSVGKTPFRDMDFVKDKVGIEVGVEIVPIKDLADEMSTGVSYFEQFVWDLKNRGVSNIDLPVLILGIAP